MGNDTETVQKFTSVTDICAKLNISRPTFYRRMSALGWNKNKRSFTLHELDRLREPLQSKSDTDSNSTVNDSPDTLSKDIIKDYQKQISELHKLLDQQQQLTLDLQGKLEDKNQQLIELKEQPKKGFWARLFG